MLYELQIIVFCLLCVIQPFTRVGGVSMISYNVAEVSGDALCVQRVVFTPPTDGASHAGFAEVVCDGGDVETMPTWEGCLACKCVLGHEVVDGGGDPVKRRVADWLMHDTAYVIDTRDAEYNMVRLTCCIGLPADSIRADGIPSPPFYRQSNKWHFLYTRRWYEALKYSCSHVS
jgi:hypothetical protein